MWIQKPSVRWGPNLQREGAIFGGRPETCAGDGDAAFCRITLDTCYYVVVSSLSVC